MDEQSKKISSPQKLSKDTNYNNQPQGTSPFILNAVEESIEGDVGGLTNETGNRQAHLFPAGFVPLHSISINNKKTAVFLANGIDSIIGTIDENDNFDIYFDDRDQTEKMGFSLGFQIDAEFRLRRGCESTLYWVDPKPRKFVLERPDKFKNDDGTWNINSFQLQRKVDKIPFIDDINVVTSGGRLKSGSYIVSVQYLDYDFNSTEFITSSQPVRVFNDSLTTNYAEIRGSSQDETEIYKPKLNTGKSIEVQLSNLDTENYPFYRLAISELNTGSGSINRVVYTKEIPTQNSRFVFTGDNYAEEGTEAEVQVSSSYIEEAKNIDQVDNMLMLSNTKGIDADLAELQKYASKIQADLKTKKVQLNIPEGANPKNPSASLEGLGYMPGEIYAQSIFYILEGNYVTPGFHIPGKSPELNNDTQFTTGENIYPMSTDNESETDKYIDNSSCGFNYWGKDSQGTDLLNSPLRHHKFPLRSDVGLPLVSKISDQSVNEESLTFQLKTYIKGQINKPPVCNNDGNDPSNCVDDLSTLDITYEIEYGRLDGSGSVVESLFYVSPINYQSFDNSIDQDDLEGYTNEEGTSGFAKLDYSSPVVAENGIEPIAITETMPDGSQETINLNSNFEGTSNQSGLTYHIDISEDIYSVEGNVYETEIFGLKFSNIEIPSKEILGKKVIGYFFGRAERNDENKTVVDTAIIGPCIKNLNQNERNTTAFFDNLDNVESNVDEKFVSHSFLFPQISQNYLNRVDDKYLYLINPEYKFNNKQYSSFSEVIQQGTFSVKNRKYSRFITQDVAEGTSYDGKVHDSSEKDNDGWSLHVRTRQNLIDFNSSDNYTLLTSDDIQDISYYSALENNVVDNANYKQFINLSADNKVGVISLKQDFGQTTVDDVPYVVLKKDIANPYSNFRSLRYIKTTKNYYVAGNEGAIEEQEEFGGDTYVSSMAYTSSVFYRAQPRRREAETGLFEGIVGYISIAVGIALIATGVGAGVGAALIGVGASFLASGIRQANIKKAYEQLYKEGLRETVVDSFMSRFEVEGNPEDDEFQWGSELSTLFFESSVNVGLRHGANVESLTDFMSSPPILESGNGLLGKNVIEPATVFDNYMLNKLTVYNKENKDRKEYIGLPKAEIYNVNKDYLYYSNQKVYEHLPIEYDACSDCRETFDKRIYYSLQSFNEELTDNFGVFLPNNYRDIQGDTGSITDVFTIKNNIYILTQHALWHLPQTYQERVTGEIVSFIGTGGYFAQPPRKIVDDDIDSAGTSYKQAVEKTRHGVLIISEKEQKIFLFDGQQLQPISEKGMASFFRSNLELKINSQYYNQNQKPYPYIDNPSNQIGAGFISVYDETKKRFILTKKDFKIVNLPNADFIICNDTGTIKLFNNIETIISDQEALGWSYVGVENCKLKFERELITAQPQTTYEIEEPPPSSYPTLTRSDFTLDNGGTTNPNYTGEDIWTGALDFDTSIQEYQINIVDSDGNSSSNGSGPSSVVNPSPGSGTSQEILDFQYNGGGVFYVDISRIKTSPPAVQARYRLSNVPEEPEPTVNETTAQVESVTKEFNYIEGEDFIPETINTSYTLSYSLKNKGAWISFHSYLPSFYLKESTTFYSWTPENQHLWRHLTKGFYNNFYGIKRPFIIEVVSNENRISTKIWEDILFQTKASVYDYSSEEFLRVKETFNKILFYNSYQISGEKELLKKKEDESYLEDQIQDSEDSIILDRNEEDYSINDIRDYRKDLSLPMFIRNIEQLQDGYFIDKKINSANIDLDKPWFDLELMRDKYLVIRFIFDNFDDTKLTMLFSYEDARKSEK